jgi:hypothetical protein
MNKMPCHRLMTSSRVCRKIDSYWRPRSLHERINANKHSGKEYPRLVAIGNQKQSDSLRRLVILAGIHLMLFLVGSSELESQVSIKEHISISPSSQLRRTQNATESLITWLTHEAGTIKITGGTASMMGCGTSVTVVLQPLHDTLCNSGSQVEWQLPGNWKAGTPVEMMVRLYPGEENPDYYCYTEYIVCDPPYRHADFKFEHLDPAWEAYVDVTPGSDFDHFRVQFNPDTIAYSDTSQIVVTAVDHGNQEVDLPGNTQLTFTLDSTRFGCFIPPAGGTASSPLSNVTYSDAKAGHVTFLASGARDTAALKRLWVTVEGAQKSGRDTLCLAPITLTFLGAETLAVYPNYPGHNNSTTKRDTIELTLSSKFRDSVKSYVWVKIGRPTLVDSGGHSHGGIRPRGTYQRKSGNNWVTVDTLRLQTDSAGTLIFRYLASRFGGIEEVKALEDASIGTGAENMATKRIKTRVPGLSLLSEGTNYVKVGGVCEHHGPRDDNDFPNCRTPDNDHYCTSTLAGAISVLADSFAVKYSTYRIRVNDTSLPYGGKFEIAGTYQPGGSHAEHRLGSNADISIRTIYQGQVTPMSPSQQGQLIRLARVATGYQPLDERDTPSPHIHLYSRED